MQHYLKVLMTIGLLIGITSSVTAQNFQSRDEWEALVEEGATQALTGSQTIGSTSITLISGYADTRIMMIHYRVSGDLPPLPMTDHAFVAEDGTTMKPFGVFNVEDGAVILFRNPTSTTGTLASYVQSARYGYDSETRETLQGDGTIIGPYTFEIALDQVQATGGSGDGIHTSSAVTMNLQQFSTSARSATATLCHNRQGYTIERATLGTISMSGASMPYDSGQQTCQQIYFNGVQALGDTATLTISQILNPTSTMDPEREVQLLRERGYNVTLKRFPAVDGYQIQGPAGGIPAEVLASVRFEMGDGIAGDWTFSVTLN